MYRSVHADIGCLHYLFLADYPPYATGGWRFVMSRHGILQSDGSLRPDVDEIFHSADYRLFRLPSARGACGDAITRP